MTKRGKVYNNFYTDEKWSMVNSENKDILNDFIEEYKQRKMSPGTINGYFQDLRIILIYIMENKSNKSILELNKKDFRGLSIWLTDTNKLSSSRVNRMKSALNSMLTYCEEDDTYDYDINYAKKVKGIPKSLVKTDEDDFFFSYEEFKKVRDILLSQGRLKDAVLWSIGFDSAGRKNELYQIEKLNLDLKNKTNVVTGKRGKKFPLVYLDDTRELIKKYLDERGEDTIKSLWYKGTEDTKCEVSSDWIYSRICSISDVLSEVRNEECKIFPHTMRHSRIECLLQGEDDRLKDIHGNNRKYTLDEVMVFVHHSDVSTTQSYAKNHDEDTINDMFGID